MRLIGIEEHFLTAEIRDAWSNLGLDAINPSVAFCSGTIEGRLLDLAESRLALMDETGLDVQVLSLTTLALHDLGPDSVDMARRASDSLAAAVARHPTRFQVILGHWGEMVLFYAERLAAMERVSGLTHPIATYLRGNLYVTGSGMFLPDYLDRAVAVVGTDRLLVSTDFPYQYRPGGDARRFLEKCDPGESAKAAFAHGHGCT